MSSSCVCSGITRLTNVLTPRRNGAESSPVWERPASERMRKLEEHDERALMTSLRAAIVRLIPTARTPLD